MRKAIFIFIAIVLVAASIDWIRSCSGLKSHKEVFGRELTYADMYEYKDADYDYVVRVPSFFTAQPDSLQEAACASSMATSGSPLSSRVM